MMYTYVELRGTRTNGCLFHWEEQQFFLSRVDGLLYRRDRVNWTRHPRTELPPEILDQAKGIAGSSQEYRRKGQKA